MVDGDTLTNDSTRAERGGRVGVLAAVVHVARMYKIQEGHILLLIDNTTALQYGTRPRYGDGPFKHLADDYDLKCWATKFEQELLWNHNIMVTYQHVYSHQDDPVKLMKINPSLTWAEAKLKAQTPSVHAQLNIACDREAEAGRAIFGGFQRTNMITPDETGAVLEIGGRHIFRQMKDHINHAAHAPGMLVYLEKYEWGEAMDYIDWDSHRKAIESLTQGQRFSVSKRIFNWLPSNARLFSWVPPQHPTPLCPICETEQETNDHIYRCSHHSCRSAQVIGLERIRAWSKKKKLHSFTISVLLRHIHAWMRGKNIDMTGRLLEANPIHSKLKQAIKEQKEIGWGHALRGRLSKKWGEIQMAVDESGKHRPRSGVIATLICKLWEEMRLLWKDRCAMQHGVTAEDRTRIANEKTHPRIRAAYSTKNDDVSYYNMRLFSMPLEERLSLDPRENNRWLEIVATAKMRRKVNEEAVMKAMRKLTAYFPLRDK